jgi:predicted secreted protein
MKMSFLTKLLIINFCVISLACNVRKGNSNVQSAGTKGTVVFRGCQENIRVAAGDVVVFQLEAIQGTGYQWMVKDSLPMLKQLDSGNLEYVVSDSREVMAGKAGFQVLRFKAVGAGEGTLRLEYKRTFEAGIEKSCVIKCLVEK